MVKNSPASVWDDLLFILPQDCFLILDAPNKKTPLDESRAFKKMFQELSQDQLCKNLHQKYMCHGQKSLYWGWSSHLKNRNPYFMGPYKPLRNWVDEFIPMEMSWELIDPIAHMANPPKHGISSGVPWFSFPRWAKHLPKLLEHSDAPSIVGLVALGGVFWATKILETRISEHLGTNGSFRKKDLANPGPKKRSKWKTYYIWNSTHKIYPSLSLWSFTKNEVRATKRDPMDVFWYTKNLRSVSSGGKLLLF